MEPAPSVVDRCATADVELGEAEIREGVLVRVSLAGAKRDPAVFPRPDRFDVTRRNVRRHLAPGTGRTCASGCSSPGWRTRVALGAALVQLPGLRLDPDRPGAPTGVVFRKPEPLHAGGKRPGARIPSCRRP